jgi:predicted kinase
MQNLDNLISTIQDSQKTLFILCGLPYAGKSYIANEIMTQANIVSVNIDKIFCNKGFDWTENKLPTEEGWNEIFNESYKETQVALSEEKNVLYDSTNQTLASRDALREIANSVGADTKVVYVKSSVESVWKRWHENEKNRNRPQVSRELVQSTIDTFEEPTKDEGVLVIEN